MNDQKQKSYLTPITDATELTPLHDAILVQDMHFGETFLKSGIVLLNDDATDRGIHPRWAKVYAVGKGIRDVVAGQWVLIEHGRWSRGFDLSKANITIRKIDPTAILLVSDEEPDFSRFSYTGKE